MEKDHGTNAGYSLSEERLRRRLYQHTHVAQMRRLSAEYDGIFHMPGSADVCTCMSGRARHALCTSAPVLGPVTIAPKGARHAE